MDNPWADELSQPALVVAEPVSDHNDPVPETNGAHIIASVSSPSITQSNDLWNSAWHPSDAKTTPHLDQWEAARQQQEKLNRAVPPELLDSILRRCQTVLQETWPSSPSNDDNGWRSGFDGHSDVSALLAQLIPADSALPPPVQFSATATAKAMNDSLKLTRHSPASATSPLSRLLASKGSLEWEKSLKAAQVVVPDTTHVGWRVLEKEDRISTLPDESKTKKVTGGLLSFWNRRTSAIPATPVDTAKERSTSPAIQPPSSQAASPSKLATPPAPPVSADPHPAVLPAVSAPSAVSRFLNRFTLTKGPQHSSLALSSDDLDFLSDIVPSANDPPDEDVDDSASDPLKVDCNSSPLPPKLPPPVPPPLHQLSTSSRPSSALCQGPVAGTSVTGDAKVPLLAPPISLQPAASHSRTQSPPLFFLKGAVGASVQSNTLSMQPRLQPGSQCDSRPSSFTFPPPQKTHPSLSVAPLLPPPPVSPPQTPRPSTFPISSTTRSADTSSFRDSYDSDDEFSAFTSFPPSSAATPFPSTEPCPSQGPPSPPPRRTYERTHYPSSSSTSSVLSPASQTSLDRLYSSKPSVSASLDSFDDFISRPRGGRSESKKRTPSPPPLPIKPQSPPPPLDTVTSRVYHAHTPSQTSFSPTVHTSLMHNAFSVPSEQHQRTQSLVDRAAAFGGLVWPNTSNSDASSAKAIPPPPSASVSPKPFIRGPRLDLLGDGDTLGGGFGALPAPLGAVGDSAVSPVAPTASRMPLGVGGDLGKGLDLRSQLQPPPPPLPSVSAPMPSFASLGKPVPLAAAANTGILQPTKPKQTGGLSAQDLSFFEGM